MKKFQKILKTLSILMVVGLMLLPASATFATGTDRPLTDREEAAFIVRDEWSAWVKGFTASLSELDKNATSRIYNNMDYYDMQYRFTEKYKKVPEYLDEDGKPTQKLKDLIKEKRKEIAGAQAIDYLKFTSKQNGSKIKYTVNGSLDESTINIGYSKDGTSFVPWTKNMDITLNSGDELYVRNKTSTLSTNVGYVQFVMTGNLEASGRVDSMINFSDIYAYCYAHLFEQCTALYTAPEVPSTTVADGCYYSMFKGCTNLGTAPSCLPASILKNQCYVAMFQDCTSLKKSPIIMAQTIVAGTNALNSMFMGCTLLEEIDIAYYKGSFNAAFNNWVDGVASSGTIYYEGPDTTVGNSAIPTGWLVFSLTKDYLTFTADEGAVDIFYTLNGSATTKVNNLYYYKSGDNKWTKWTASVSLNQGESMKVWNNSTSAISTSDTDYIKFTTSAKVACSGNVNSLKGFSDVTNRCYFSLFNATKITTAPTLPSTTLANFCYERMFQDCDELVTPPELPAQNINVASYRDMFHGCTKLTSVPNGLRNVSIISNFAYSGMFQNCSSLISVPRDLIPSTTMRQEACYSMFEGCSKLKNAPNLPSTSLERDCYNGMFKDCVELETVPEILPAVSVQERCYTQMFMGCTKITKSPRIAATSLATDCFAGMFNGCSLLKEITIDYTGGIETYFNDWVSGVADVGTFYYNGSYSTYGSSNIPKDSTHPWTVQTFTP